MRPPQQLSDYLLQLCGQWNERTAVRSGACALTYADLARLIRDLASQLEQGEKTSCMLVPEPSPLSVALLYGALHAGRVVFIADPAWERRALLEQCRALGCATVLTGQSYPFEQGDHPRSIGASAMGLARVWTLPSTPQMDVTASETAVVRFSSGSSGRPRALEFPSTSIVRAAATWREAARIERDDRILCLASLNNGLAFNTSLMTCFQAGASLHLYEGLLVPSAIVREMERVQPTILVAFPFLLELMIKQGERLRQALHSCRLIVSSAAPLTQGVADRWRQLTGHAIGHYYGIAETGPVTFNPGCEGGSAGHKLPGTEVKVSGDADAPGRLIVRTAYGATRYVPDGGEPLEKSLNEEGYYVSNDVGFVDEAGRVHVVGRVGRVVNVAGRKFSLDDVEHAISLMAGVTGVHVCSDAGRIHAYVEANASLTKDDVKKHCVQHLPAIQVPHAFHVLSVLPRSASGKINLDALKREAVKPSTH